jgi:hypothetical protein
MPVFPHFSGMCIYSGRGALKAAITVVAVSTLTGHSTAKFIKTLKNVFLNLKGQVPLNKKKCPAEREEIISYPLIPLLTYVSFRCTVPLILICPRYLRHVVFGHLP